MDAKLRKIEVSRSPFRSIHDFDDDDDEYSSDELTQYSDEYSDHPTNSGNIKKKRLDSINCSKQSYPNDLHIMDRSESRASSASAIKRMPTRKPDPKISNRNAIMARENRRRKKEHMEELEKTVDEVQSENKKLRKMLQVRNSKITKLTQESLYLRSILANKTEIMSLLKCIQGNQTPITSSTLSFVADKDLEATLPATAANRKMSRCSTGYSPASSSMSPASYEEDDKENDHLQTIDSERMDFGAAALGGSLMAPSTGCMVDPLSSDFRWENFLTEYSGTRTKASPLHIPDIHDIDDNEILSTTSSNTVNIEHNYFNNPITKKVADDSADGLTPGVCLHVSSGRVSLEFCASCHINSQNAWCEEM